MKDSESLIAVADSDSFTARQLAKGLTLVPYWGRSEDGLRIPCSAWVRLRPGESVSDAAHRLTNILAGRV